MTVNKAILIGNVGQDPEMRQTVAGVAVTNIRLATHDAYKDKRGVRHESTEWHRIVAFGKLAEMANKGLVKGSKVYFEGKIQTRKWTDRDGNDKYTTEIVAKEMKFLETKDFRSDNGPIPKEDAPPVQEPSPMGDDVPF